MEEIQLKIDNVLRNFYNEGNRERIEKIEELNNTILETEGMTQKQIEKIFDIYDFKARYIQDENKLIKIIKKCTRENKYPIYDNSNTDIIICKILDDNILLEITKEEKYKLSKRVFKNIIINKAKINKVIKNKIIYNSINIANTKSYKKEKRENGNGLESYILIIDPKIDIREDLIIGMSDKNFSKIIKRLRLTKNYQKMYLVFVEILKRETRNLSREDKIKKIEILLDNEFTIGEEGTKMIIIKKLRLYDEDKKILKNVMINDNTLQCCYDYNYEPFFPHILFRQLPSKEIIEKIAINNNTNGIIALHENGAILDKKIYDKIKIESIDKEKKNIALNMIQDKNTIELFRERLYTINNNTRTNDLIEHFEKLIKNIENIKYKNENEICVIDKKESGYYTQLKIYKEKIKEEEIKEEKNKNSDNKKNNKIIKIHSSKLIKEIEKEDLRLKTLLREQNYKIARKKIIEYLTSLVKSQKTNKKNINITKKNLNKIIKEVYEKNKQ